MTEMNDVKPICITYGPFEYKPSMKTAALCSTSESAPITLKITLFVKGLTMFGRPVAKNRVSVLAPPILLFSSSVSWTTSNIQIPPPSSASIKGLHFFNPKSVSESAGIFALNSSLPSKSSLFIFSSIFMSIFSMKKRLKNEHRNTVTYRIQLC